MPSLIDSSQSNWTRLLGAGQFCYEHDRIKNPENGEKNYIRDFYWLKRFESELSNLANPELSNFYPSPKWYIDEARRVGFAMGLPEIRKLIYFLVRSRLDTEKRKSVYKMREQGLSISEISSRTGVSRQAVHKSLSIIDTKMDEIIHCASINEPIDCSGLFEPYSFISSRNGQTYKSLRLATMAGPHSQI